MIRDFMGDRGRASLMLVAIAVGIFGVTVMLSTYSILSREITRNYMDTNPASATIDVGETNPAMLKIARDFPGIAEAEARSVVLARVKVGTDWLPMRLFVVENFEHLQLNTFTQLAGAWPPLDGSMLIERTAERVLKQGLGGFVTIKTENGTPTDVSISGLVHDATLAPAWQDQTGYGYITRRTLGMLGENPILEELRIQLDGNPADIALVEAKTQALAQALREQGHTVHELRVPPPRTHPHQTQMTGILFLFLAFAIMAFFLGTILVATIVAALLARQLREIGVMKAIGARSGQIATLYLVTLLVIGLFSTMAALPAGLYAAKGLVNMVAELLNLTVDNYFIPARVYLALIASGILIPPLVAFPVIIKGTSISVHEAISDNGATIGTSGGWFSATLTKMFGFGLAGNMALRNMFRRRARLYLALALLTAGGGMFISALNVNKTWDVYVDRVTTDRFYDVEFILNKPVSEARISQALDEFERIKQLEFWGYSPTVLAQTNKIDIARTYPDGGHGSFTLLGLPPETTLIDFPLMQGRWLQNDDLDVVVLNQIAKAMVGEASIGDAIRISLDGEHKTLQLVGVVEEVGSGATAYISDLDFDTTLGTIGRAQMIRIMTSSNNPVDREALIRKIDNKLQQAGIVIKKAVPLSLLKTAMGEHVVVLVATLIMTAILLAVIGLLGLASTMSMNVIERTRELGIMKVSGATPFVIVKIITIEGVLIALMSWVLAVLVSLPLSYQIGSFIGYMTFKMPIGLSISWFAVFLWLGLVIVLAAVASMVPAWRASRMPVHHAISYG